MHAFKAREVQYKVLIMVRLQSSVMVMQWFVGVLLGVHSRC